MKLTVFGASGKVGQEIVRQALAAGHGVTAVVRARSRASGCARRPLPEEETNRVPRLVTRMDPTPRCMPRW